MRILVIGAEGTLGRAVVAALGSRHQIVKAGRSSGEVHVDIADSTSIAAMYDKNGELDAVVCCAGHSNFAPLNRITEEQFLGGLKNKLMGQVNLVLRGQAYLNDGGSFTLTSGSLDRYPVRQGSNAATVNAALGGFVRAAAIDLDRGLRINLVSPALLDESAAKLATLLPGQESISSARAGLAYVKSVEGGQTGQIYCIG
ncbi:MAG: short chain dehydrogenase [Rhizobiales bacterium]|nr:short chain dehydrogenase [Hyphomicrobiales bacterium]